MNCLEFRRAFETEPGGRDLRLGEHRADCPSCAAFAARVLRFDRLLREAARVPVPAELASRVLLRQAFGRARRGGVLPRRDALALAASLLAATALGVFSYHHLRSGEDRLGREVVAMVRNAPYALAPSEPLPASRIARALRPAGVAMRGPIGTVTFAGRCLIQGRLAGHLVVAGRHAPVTIFLIPEERVASRRTVRGHRLAALLVPTAGGTIAVVGAEDEPLAGIASLARAAVRWST